MARRRRKRSNRWPLLGIALIVVLGVGAYFLLTPKYNAGQERTAVLQKKSQEPTTTASTEEATANAESEGSVQPAKEPHLSLDDFVALNQNPGFPTGCEITSLTATLNYYSFQVDIGYLSENYLDKGPVGSTDPRVAFVGSPKNDSSYGCYAPVIVATANKYLADQGSALRARDLTGTSFRDLFPYIDRGTPVIVWTTRYLREGSPTVTWQLSSGPFTWRYPQHCVVLVGYDLAKDSVLVADPLEGEKVEYPLSKFEDRYDYLKKQAVVIQ